MMRALCSQSSGLDRDRGAEEERESRGRHRVMRQPELNPSDIGFERPFRASRRSILRGGAGVAGAGLLTAVEERVHPALARTWTTSIPRRARSSAATDDLAVFPL